MVLGRHSAAHLFKGKSEGSQSSSSDSSSSSSESSEVPEPWIEENITMLECAKYIPARKSMVNSRCHCGLSLKSHSQNVKLDAVTQLGADGFRSLLVKNGGRKAAIPSERWHVKTHTKELPTNAYGTVEFQGGPHPTRAKYVRLHYETSPETVLHLLLHEWRIRVPNLVISMLGGLANTPLQSKLQRVVQSGLLRAAKTTGAWVITNGLDIGVTRHIGEALGDEVHVRGSNIVALGIAPWGFVQLRETLVGLNHTCAYYSQGWRPGCQDAPLHSHHNYFLLADNGTTGKFGGELCLRRRLEQYLAQQPIDMRRYGGSKSRVPIVGVLLEGGQQTFRTVFELVTGRYPVPVVVCDGSGRAADLLAFMHRYANEDGDLPAPLKEQVISTISRTFQLHRQESEGLYSELRLCMKRRHFISIFRMGEGDSDEIDIAILTSLLQVSGHKLTPAEQLSLTMAWDRPDIARSKVFTSCRTWSTTTLENAMTDALLNDRLEFVRLLLAKGLVIQRFLNVGKLEELYVVAGDANNRWFHQLFTMIMGTRQRITLRAVGQLIENLIGGGYQHSYCDKSGFGRLAVSTQHVPSLASGAYSSDQQLAGIVHKLMSERKLLHRKSFTCSTFEQTADQGLQKNSSGNKENINMLHKDHDFYHRSCLFRYPYTELLQWALLTRRYKMARFMVLAGEESIAKALFSVKLLRGIRHASVHEESDVEAAKEFRAQEDLFERLALDLQDHCYRHDPDQAKRLLIYELRAFSNNTCLSLAHMCESKMFIGHMCTQSILNDLWYGGLRNGNLVGAKVALLLIGMSLPPLYPLIAYCMSTKSKFIEFKTKEELAQQPQTLQEYLDELGGSSTSSSSSSSSSSSTSSSRSGTPRPSFFRDVRSGTVNAIGGIGDHPVASETFSEEPVNVPTLPSGANVDQCQSNSRRTVHRRSKLSRRNTNKRLSHIKEVDTTSESISIGHSGRADSLSDTKILPTPHHHKRRRRRRLFSRNKTSADCNVCPNPTNTPSSIVEHVSEDGNTMVGMAALTHDTALPPTSTAQLNTNVNQPQPDGQLEFLSTKPQGTVDVTTGLGTRFRGSIPVPLTSSSETAGVVDHPRRSTLQTCPSLPSRLYYSTSLNQDGKPIFPLRSNLAALLPSNHYASVAVSAPRHDKIKSRGRRRSRMLQHNSDGIEGATNRHLSPDAVHRRDFPATRWNVSTGHLAPMRGDIDDRGSDDLKKLPQYYSSAQSTPEKMDGLPSSTTSHPLSWRKRIYEFFSAPVTRFYLHVILYLTFLIFYIGLCLHTIPARSWSWLEIYIYLHIITYFLDKFREVKLARGSNYCQKLRVHLRAYWNTYDMIMCCVSIIGIALRYLGMVYLPLYMWGKNLLIVCCALWQLRFFELMQIWRFSGPIIYTVFMMIRVMIPMLSLVFLPLLAFGTVRQGIMYPNRTHVDLNGVKGTMLKPYFMIYGEVYADEIDPVDWPEESIDAPFKEAVPIATVIFLLYGIIVFISVIIATFNDIFSRMRQQSELVYNYLRYAVIIEYESRPLLPPPFIVISWIYMLMLHIHRLRKKRRALEILERMTSDGRSSVSGSAALVKEDGTPTSRSGDLIEFRRPDRAPPSDMLHTTNETAVGLKLFLTSAEVEKLHDFEEECVDDYWRELRKLETLDNERHTNVLNQKLDHLQFRISEVHIQQNQLRGQVSLLNDHLRLLEDNISHVNSQSPYAAKSSFETQKETVLLESLMWLMDQQISKQAKQRPISVDDPGDNLMLNATDIRNKLSSCLRTLASEDRQEQQYSRAVFVRERSPSPPSKTGSKHKLSKPDVRVSTSGQSIPNLYSFDSSKLKNVFSRSRGASYRGHDCAYREYTTICDDIDISCLSLSDSSTTSATGSHTDIPTIVSGMRSRQVSEKRSPLKLQPIPSIHVSETIIPSEPSLNEDDEYLGEDGEHEEILEGSRIPTSTTQFYLAPSSTASSLHTSPERGTSIHYQAEGGVGGGKSPSVPVFSQPMPSYEYKPDQPADARKSQRIASPVEFKGRQLQRRSSARSSDITTHSGTPADKTSLPSFSASKLFKKQLSLDNEYERGDREWDSNLQEAEKAERAELRGVLIKRLRKLSIASGSYKPSGGTTVPPDIVSSPTESFQPGSLEDLAQASSPTVEPPAKFSRLLIPNCGIAVVTSAPTTMPNTPAIQVSSIPFDRPLSCIERPQKLSFSCGALTDPTAFSSADVGDFLTHNVDEADAVDPDLDLDLYSVATRASSTRRSSDSQLIGDSSTNWLRPETPGNPVELEDRPSESHLNQEDPQ